MLTKTEFDLFYYREAKSASNEKINFNLTLHKYIVDIVDLEESMKKFNSLAILLILMLALSLFVACDQTDKPFGDNPFMNPGDVLGGGGVGVNNSQDTDTTAQEEDIEGASSVDESALRENLNPDGATLLIGSEITVAGDYVLTGNYENGVTIDVENGETTHIYLSGATVSNDNGVAILNSNKKSTLIITLVEGTTNIVSNACDDENAIHVKGDAIFNGKGKLIVNSTTKNGIKVSKSLVMVDGVYELSAANHGITAKSIHIVDSNINVLSAGKDGIQAECDDDTHEFTFDEGFVVLDGVTYTAEVCGDGIQADTFVLIKSGSYTITTKGEFVSYSSANMDEYDLVADDYKYVKSTNDFMRIASDSNTAMSRRYALKQGCKGIKVGEIEYDGDDDGEDDVTVTDGQYSIVINSGTFNIDSTDDAIHANSGDVLINGGTFIINTYDDGITADKLTQINGGDIAVESSYEGIEGARIEISGLDTTIDIVSSDDGINAASDVTGDTMYILISGGYIRVNTSGDGVDSNGSIVLDGGVLVVEGPTSGADAALDSDKGMIVNGGYLFATGTLGMIETPASNSAQCSVSFAASSNISAGSVISLRDGNGNVIYEFTVAKTSRSIIISCPEFVTGASYSIWSGDSQLVEFTISSIITSVGTNGSFSGGQGGPGGRPGGFGR